MTDFTKHFQPYENEIFRMVEGQHFISTRKLVDNDTEQQLLEEILERSKPIAPLKNSRGPLHYLLYTPFRYPPLKSGGRFHTRMEQSIFYGSEELNTAMAEVAYNRFLFRQHTEAILRPMQVPHTHFVVKVKSEKSVLLTREPFREQAEQISHAATYAHSQPLGSAMRRAGVELFTYYSARKPQGINVGLFCAEPLRQNRPILGKERHWSVYVSAQTIEFQRVSLQRRRKELHVFKKEDFYVGDEFPAIF